jgi:hypothetical protein
MPKFSVNPTSESMRGREVELGSLDLGSYFHVWGTNGRRLVSGYLMDRTVSCCYVLPTSETDDNIQGPEGELRRVVRLGETIDWASDSPVEFVEVDPEVRAGIMEAKSERERRRQGYAENKQEQVPGVPEMQADNRMEVGSSAVGTQEIAAGSVPPERLRGSGTGVVRTSSHRAPEEGGRIVMSLQLSDDPRMRAIQVRWSFQVKQLSIGLQTGNLPKTTTARQTLKAIVEQAVEQGVLSLPPIPEYVEDDPVFDELRKYIVARPNEGVGTVKSLGVQVGKQHGGSQEGLYKRVTAVSSIPAEQLKDDVEREQSDDEGESVMALSAKKGTAAGATALVEPDEETVELETGTEEAVNGAGQTPAQASGPSKAERLKAQQAAAKAGAKAKGATAVKIAPKAKKVVTLGPCLDGCGANVAAKFAPGHDAKLKSLILKIERGDEPMQAVAEMPAAAYLKFKKGPVMPSDDGKTKVQTYLCTQAPVRLQGRDDVKFVEVTRE